MSEKKNDKGKLFHKLHQLQKRLFRSKTNEGHHNNEQDKLIEVKEKHLIEKIKGKGKI
jgi:hypothetical protein